VMSAAPSLAGSSTGVRRDDGTQLAQGLPSESMPLHREATPLLIGEAKALIAELLAQRAVLALEVLDDLELIPVDPTGEHRQDEVPRRHGDHGDTPTVLVQAGGLEKAGRPASTDARMPGNRPIVARLSDLATRGIQAEFSVE
jgi:hypothetical protein